MLVFTALILKKLSKAKKINGAENRTQPQSQNVVVPTADKTQNMVAIVGIISQFIYVGDITSQERNQEFGYKVTAEDSLKGLARLNIECLKPNSDDIENSQGVDLTATECRAIANMLINCALLIENEKE